MRDEPGDRRTFQYAVNIHGIDFEGIYLVDHGYIDTLDLPDGTTVAINLDGSPIRAGQDDDALALARMIAKAILACPLHQNEMDQTLPRYSWAGYAPVVL